MSLERRKSPGRAWETLPSTIQLEVAFDTLGLNDGIPIFTPGPDGVLVTDVLIEVIQTWDDSCLVDVGQVDKGYGFWDSYAAGKVDPSSGYVTWADYWSDGSEYSTQAGASLASAMTIYSAGGGFPYNPSLPLGITEGNRIGVWVSVDGNRGSDAPAATQGVLRVVLFLAYPGPVAGMPS